ncbi:MAG: hypothetical protein U0792_09790 [Gemmataceae bacterium]
MSPRNRHQNHLTGEQRRYSGTWSMPLVLVVAPTQIWGYLSEAKDSASGPGHDPIRAKFDARWSAGCRGRLAAGSMRIAQESSSRQPEGSSQLRSGLGPQVGFCC